MGQKTLTGESIYCCLLFFPIQLLFHRYHAGLVAHVEIVTRLLRNVCHEPASCQGSKRASNQTKNFCDNLRRLYIRTCALSSRATLRLQPTAGLDPNMRLGNFLELLERETGLRAKEIDILTGYPPAPVRVPHDPDSLLSCLAISNGDTLLIRRQETTSFAASEPTAVTSKSAANSPASEGTQVQGSSHSS